MVASRKPSHPVNTAVPAGSISVHAVHSVQSFNIESFLFDYIRIITDTEDRTQLQFPSWMMLFDS